MNQYTISVYVYKTKHGFLLGTMVQNQYIKQASTHMWGIINVYTINSEAAEHINKRQKQLLNKKYFRYSWTFSFVGFDYNIDFMRVIVVLSCVQLL